VNKTPIGWVKNPDGSQGYTWNPITGCLNGCSYCYARKLAEGRLRDRYLANHNFPNYLQVGFPHTEQALLDPFYPRFWPERAREEFGAWSSGTIPKGIFVCDMGELFGDWVPQEWTRRILNKIGMSYYREHRFYLLTKQPQNLIKFSPFPDNCWVGVTATGRRMYVEALRGLKDVRASVRYISFEPVLERIVTNDGWIVQHAPDANPDDAFMLTLTGIQWVIIGACTGTKKDLIELNKKYPELTLMPYGRKWSLQPPVEWVEEIVRAADRAGVNVFLKDNLKPLIIQNPIDILAKPSKILYELDGVIATADIGGSNWGRQGDYAVDQGGVKRLKIKEILDIQLGQEMPIGRANLC